jgi:hypothetical protein
MAIFSVYYMKSDFFGEGVKGYAWLKKRNLVPDPAALTKSHVFLKLIEAHSPEDAYFRMQGDNWSATGEARELIASKGVRHTSMSVGDIVIDQDSRVAYILDRMGFRFLGTVPMVDEP